MAGTVQETLIERGAGMKVSRRFTEPGVHPFDQIEWEMRTAELGQPGTDKHFKQENVEFPVAWSQNATNIVAQKYFRGQKDSPERENSVKQMVTRVARTIADWGRERDYFASAEDADTFEAELTYILVHQMAAFNSPVWFNVGFEENPQCSACFILSVEDTMDSILDWNTKEGRIFIGGSGSGINLSRIRGSMETLSKGGTASGPVSYMRGADSWAGTIKSGGKTRRAAKMVVLDADHPDIREFIWCKAKEEDKAETLRDAGFDMSIDGDGFISVQYQNANNSVRVNDEFMRAVESGGQWRTLSRRTGEPIGEPLDSRKVMRDIAEAAWRCADPGVQYDTVINQWHTCPNSGRINASNPCSEYMHVDNSACNLASLNLMKYRREDGTLDVEKFNHAVDIVFMAQEITVGTPEKPASSFPTEEIAVNARAFRQIGLGYANLGAFLMSNGMPYDSDQGRAAAAAITALMTGRAYLQSAKLAAAVGSYEHYELNREPHNGVMRMHRDASYAIPEDLARDDELVTAARQVWDEAVEAGEAFGYRNAQATVLAPTGTISFLMDCDTTGVEPDFSLVKFKELVGGGTMTIANQTIPLALRTLGYSEDEIGSAEYDDQGNLVDGTGIVGHVAKTGTIIGAPGLKDEHLPVFDVAVGQRPISWRGHVDMMGAVQPFISGAISKTINMPNEATVEEIEEAFLHAWRIGVKALAIYRDGSKTAQALRTDAQNSENVGAAKEAAEQLRQSFAKKQKDVDEAVRVLIKAIGGDRRVYLPETVEHIMAAALEIARHEPTRKRMPRERQSITHKFEIGGHEGYITAGMYEDGTVGEIFITDVGKEGSTLRGMMNSFATAISISLQYGVPLELLVRKFSYMRFEPEGITVGNPEIPFAKSMPDYIMRWLASRFLKHDVEFMEELGIQTEEVRAAKLVIAGGDGAAATFTPVPAGDEPAEVAEQMAERGGVAVATAQANGNGNGHKPSQKLDLGPACSQCGGMMQRTGACYTCSSCGNNTGCG